MVDDLTPRNELIRRLLSKLTPEGLEAWEDLERAVADSTVGDDREEILMPPLSRLTSLPKQDREIVERLFDFHIRALQADIEEGARRGAQLDWEMMVEHRAYELLGSEDEDARWPETLEEALAILARHGEHPPPPPEG